MPSNAALKLRPQEFFQGHIQGWGLFEDFLGNVRREFSVELHGHKDDDGTVVLDEKFFYDDGETDERQWRLTIGDDGRVKGTAGDVDGHIQGSYGGRALNLAYKLILPMYGRRVGFQVRDRYFLREPGILLNRASLRKVGFKIGDIYATFRHAEAERDPAVAEAAE